MFIAILPSLSWFKPALPSRPIDICPRDGPDGCFCHYVPTGFDAPAVALLNLPRIGESAPAAGEVVASDPLVEVGVVNAQQCGSVLLLINWQMQPSKDLTISVREAALGRFSKAVRASDGKAVGFTKQTGRWEFALPGVLEVADAVVLRH